MRAGSHPSALWGLPLLPASNRQGWSHPVSPPGVSGPTGEIFLVGPTVTGGWGCVLASCCSRGSCNSFAEAGVLSKILGHKSQKLDPSSPERRKGLVSS